MTTITDVSVRRIDVPLSSPWGPDVTTNTILEVTITDSDGAQGFGFSWAPTWGTHAVEAMLRTDLTQASLGRDIEDPLALWEHLWTTVHEAGGGGVTTIALAGIDLAVWDLLGRRANKPSIELFAGAELQPASMTEIYGSGINLHYSDEELAQQAQRWKAEGFKRIKLKVGSPELERDVRRVAMVRDILGPETGIMIDANQRWNLQQAIKAVNELETFKLEWIEEPLRADDLHGHSELRDAINIPIACGENLYNHYRFAEFTRAGVMQFAQPNVVRVGGFSGLRRIMDALSDQSVEIAPHLMFDLSAQISLALPGKTLVEDVESASFSGLGILADSSPVTRLENQLVTDLKPGLGLRFK